MGCECDAAGIALLIGAQAKMPTTVRQSAVLGCPQELLQTESLLVRQASSVSREGGRIMLRKLTFATLSLTVLTVLLPAIQAQNVVTDWTAIAAQTIIHNAQKPPAAGTIFFAYAAIASYDAVNAIDRRHEPFY